MANVTILQLPTLSVTPQDVLEVQKTDTSESGKISIQDILDLVPAPPGTVWGQIGGALSNQTDLQDALNAKADASQLANYLPITGGTLTGNLVVNAASLTLSSVGASAPYGARIRVANGNALGGFVMTGGAAVTLGITTWAEGSEVGQGWLSMTHGGNMTLSWQGQTRISIGETSVIANTVNLIVGNINGSNYNSTIASKADVSALNAHTGNTSIHFADAPNDGQQYARQSLGWAVVSGGTAPAWGQITGTLSNQTDLQNALNAKSNVADVYTKAEVDNAIAAAVASYLPLTGGAITGTLSVTGNISSNADVLAFQP